MAILVGGMSKLTAQLDAVGLAFTTEDLIMGANVILDHAQALCPVDTGFLRASGNLLSVSGDVWIIFDAEYASFVEYGTSKMAAQPFLRPAIDEAELEALSAIVDSVTAHMRDITA